MAFIWGVIAYDGVSLSRSCLTVREDGRIDTLEELFDGILYKIEDVFLRGFRRQYIIELHVGVVAWPANLQGVILTESRLTS